MSSDKLSASLAIAAALVVVVASNKQWWTVSYNGVLITRRWATRMLVFVAGLLITALSALWVPSGGRAIVVGAVGLLLSAVAGWFVGSWIHRRNVAKFKGRNAGLAGTPLAGGDFD